MRTQHEQYVRALRAAGLNVIELEPLETHPDSHFVEDVALCLPQGVLVLRPGAPSRRGEVDAIEAPLRQHFAEVRHLQSGRIDGGDILMTASELWVGLSDRTDAKGIEALQSAVASWGEVVRTVETPRGVLHFKTHCSLLDEETLLATPLIAPGLQQLGHRIVTTAPGEESAANGVRINQVFILPSGYPRTADKLAGLGYQVRLVDNSECALLDGGMSCLSLRFKPAPRSGGNGSLRQPR